MTINIRGNLVELSAPVVMGIVNVTPDSFYAGSRVDGDHLLARVEGMLGAGAGIYRPWGYSSRPGAA